MRWWCVRKPVNRSGREMSPRLISTAREDLERARVEAATARRWLEELQKLGKLAGDCAVTGGEAGASRSEALAQLRSAGNA